ncbi:MAG TPA: hypothetical protein VHT04_04950 [Stellaceae bacterium]|jgi:hypothetical protein|nr:hypothetical protein [Stellaceae bacterium]
MTDTMLVLTVEGADTIIAQGGSQHWRVTVSRARQQKYLVCAQNERKALAERDNWPAATGTEPHGSGFLVGVISDIVPSGEPGRSRICISKVARIAKPNLWPRVFGPVLYRNIADLGIDLATLKWQHVRSPTPIPATDAPVQMSDAALKAAFAANHGVPLESVTVTIRL